MKIINLGILAHVDAGKTALTEKFVYQWCNCRTRSVDEGTTRTDTMNLERQGESLSDSSDIFQWGGCKVNIIDTPGHMDFFGGSIPFFIRIRRSSIISFLQRMAYRHRPVYCFWRYR